MIIKKKIICILTLMRKLSILVVIRTCVTFSINRILNNSCLFFFIVICEYTRDLQCNFPKHIIKYKQRI